MRRSAAGATYDQKMTTAQDKAPDNAQPGLPWAGRAQRAALICWFGIAISGLYALALIPLRPLLIGHHPVLRGRRAGGGAAGGAAGAGARGGGGPRGRAGGAAGPGGSGF